jgi:peptide/nickel transport system substrate-binding protein
VSLVLGLVAAALIAGCGADVATTTGAGGSLSEAALSPTPIPSVPAATKTLQTLTWNLNQGEPLTLDSGKVVDYDDQMVLANMCEPLMQLKPDGKTVPALATSISESNPTTYIVHVRTGVKFWNGQTMTPADVAFSLNRQLDPSLGSYFVALNLGAFKSATVSGSATVTIHLSHADSLFEPLLTTPFSQVVEESFVKAHGSSYGNPQVGPMCTGPYEFVNWSPGQSLTVRQFPGWWDAANQKRLTEQAKFTFVSDTNTATQGEVRGEINGGFMIPDASVARLSAAGTLVNGPSTLFDALAGTSDQGTAGNTKIRQAVAKLIDYAGFESAEFGETAEVGRALAGPDTWGEETSAYESAYKALPAPTYDIAAARQLVKDSGIKNPMIEIATTPVNPGSTELFSQLQQSAPQAGLKIVVKSLSLGAFASVFTSKSARAPYAFAYYEGNADIPSPLELYDQLALPAGGTNYSRHADPMVTRLLDEANATTNAAQQASLVARAQTTIVNEADWIPIVLAHLTTYLSKGIGGLQVEFPSVLYTPWLTTIGAS